MTNSHSHCDHDATKSARAACRKLRAQGIDTTISSDNLAAARLHRIATNHDLRCCWHVTMAILENWDTSQIEDPTAEWCKGEPTVDYLVDTGRDLIGGICYCD